MTTLILIYLAVGFFSYWPLVWHYKIHEMDSDTPVWGWLAAWATWCLFWPIRYAQDAWYWWRAKK